MNEKKIIGLIVGIIVVCVLLPIVLVAALVIGRVVSQNRAERYAPQSQPGTKWVSEDGSMTIYAPQDTRNGICYGYLHQGENESRFYICLDGYWVWFGDTSMQFIDEDEDFDPENWNRIWTDEKYAELSVKCRREDTFEITVERSDCLEVGRKYVFHRVDEPEG